MMQLLEFSPLLLFWAAYKLKDIYWATGTLMVCCVLLLFVHRAVTGKYKKMHILAAVLALVLGTATLLYRDPRFIQWKLTVLMALTSLAFLFSMAFGKQTLTQRMMESAFDQPVEVTRRVWQRLNLLWVVWFGFLSYANLYIAHNFSESTWVSFKSYGIAVALFLFMLPQVFWLSSKLKQPAEGASTP